MGTTSSCYQCQCCREACICCCRSCVCCCCCAEQWDETYQTSFSSDNKPERILEERASFNPLSRDSGMLMGKGDDDDELSQRHPLTRNGSLAVTENHVIGALPEEEVGLKVSYSSKTNKVGEEAFQQIAKRENLSLNVDNDQVFKTSSASQVQGEQKNEKEKREEKKTNFEGSEKDSGDEKKKKKKKEKKKNKKSNLEESEKADEDEKEGKKEKKKKKKKSSLEESEKESKKRKKKKHKEKTEGALSTVDETTKEESVTYTMVDRVRGVQVAGGAAEAGVQSIPEEEMDEQQVTRAHMVRRWVTFHHHHHSPCPYQRPNSAMQEEQGSQPEAESGMVRRWMVFHHHHSTCPRENAEATSSDEEDKTGKPK